MPATLNNPGVDWTDRRGSKSILGVYPAHADTSGKITTGASRNNGEYRLRIDALTLFVKEPIDDFVERPIPANHDNTLVAFS